MGDEFYRLVVDTTRFMRISFWISMRMMMIGELLHFDEPFGIPYRVQPSSTYMVI